MRGSDEPFLLIGPQRSGTTALAHALSAAIASHGGCFTVNGRLPYLLRRWWTPADVGARHLRADEVAHSLARRPVDGVGVAGWVHRAQGALWRSAARAAEARGPLSCDEEVRRVCREAYGGGPWGDKYNEYLLDLEWLDRVWPNARWVFIVRDPGDTISSMLAWSEKKVWNPRAEVAAADKWALWAERWLAFRLRVPPTRRLELDYDELCRGADSRLTEFVGVEMTRHLAGFSRRRTTTVRAELTDAAGAAKAQLVSAGILRSRDKEPRGSS